MSSPYGTKKNTPRNTSQVKPCAPFLATAPIVSSPTRVQIRKNTRSKRRRLFWSLDFSSISSVVMPGRVNTAALSATMSNNDPGRSLGQGGGCDLTDRRVDDRFGHPVQQRLHVGRRQVTGVHLGHEFEGVGYVVDGHHELLVE